MGLLEVLHAERLCALAASKTEIEACKKIAKEGGTEHPAGESETPEAEVRNAD
jgi:hypothetical protein